MVLAAVEVRVAQVILAAEATSKAAEVPVAVLLVTATPSVAILEAVTQAAATPAKETVSSLRRF